MKIKGYKEENFNDFKVPSMFISTHKCSGKCWKELGFDKNICQNNELYEKEFTVIENDFLINLYKNNSITEAIILGGLEPFDDFYDILDFVNDFRKISNDMLVLYTGYYENEIQDKIELLKKHSNIYLKVGRFIPNQEKVKDKLTGVILANKEQKFIKIS